MQGKQGQGHLCTRGNKNTYACATGGSPLRARQEEHLCAHNKRNTSVCGATNLCAHNMMKHECTCQHKAA